MGATAATLAPSRRPSLLRNLGFDDVSDILGGYAGWEAVHGVAV